MTKILSWALRLTAAFIMGQTLFFKFMGAPESIHIFQTLGAEPWGRYGTGLAELAAVVLLLVPRTAPFGGLLGIGLMVGAIGSHLTKLGITVQGDGGLLFLLAVTALVASAGTVWIERGRLKRA
jgi:hypothetical protein